MNANHPAADQLAAFASGQAPHDSAVQISQHLAECDSCRTLVDSLPEDTLVSLLRQSSGPADLPTNGKAEVREALTAVGSSEGECSDVPKELANHPRYDVLGLLGSGGMGAVYKAEHRRMERPVALKVINAALTNRPDMVQRFEREAKAAAKLTHPNIVTAYDSDQAGDIHFLVMEFVEGTSLAQRVGEQGPLLVADACAYIQQAALGLQHAFEQGMVHRDIKPHNLMLTPRGQVKILDFGLARFARETVGAAAEPEAAASALSQAKSGLTEVGVLMGTADFIAPEQASDPRKADIRADIYSLGCTLYYLLAGHAPFPEGTAVDKLIAHAERSPKPLSKLRADIPAELGRVVDRMMAKNPKDRYQTPGAVAAALTPFLGKPRQRKRLLPRLAVAAGLVAAAVIAAIVIIIQTDQGELEIKTSDKETEVLVNQKGVKIRDTAAKREYLVKVGKRNIRGGQYEVEVSELPAGLEITTNRTFSLKRGDRKIVEIAFKPKEETMCKKFGPTDKPISGDLVSDQGGWRWSDSKKTTTVRLFEIANPGVEDCTVSYRARLKTEKLEGKAYLEMWCRFKGQEFFSRGLHNTVSGTTDWSAYETPFFLKKGERPDLIRLNLVVEGKGTVWIKDVEVLRLAPMEAGNDAGKDGRIKAFGPKDKTLTQDRVVAEDGGWRIDARAKETRTVRLFEVPDPGVANSLVFYRLKMKTKLQGEAYQVMWCRLPGMGEFFSKGLDKKVTGNTDWITLAIPFRLEKGQRPDLIKLDLSITGPG